MRNLYISGKYGMLTHPPGQGDKKSKLYERKAH
jgi:hypothetical protein